VHWQPTRPTKHDIAAIRGVEAREIPAVRVGDHGAIPALERAGQQLADRGRLPGSGRAQELEVLVSSNSGISTPARGKRPGWAPRRGDAGRVMLPRK